jgi:hypothetical protein
VAGLLIVGGNAGKASTVSTTPVAGIGIERLGNSYASGSSYGRYSYVAVGIADAAEAGALDTTSLVYTSGTSVPQSWTAGVPYGLALANGWLLKDAGGDPVMNLQYGRNVGDFGNRAYQEAFIGWTLAFLRENHNEGIEIDDVVCDAAQLTHAYPAKYPNRRAWEEAQVSFVAAVGDALRAHGYYVLANATCFVRGDLGSNDGSLTASFWRRLAPHVSGLMSEYWLQLPTDPTTVRRQGTDDWMYHWSTWQRLVEVAQEGGADFFALMYGSATSTSVMRYGKAAFLLDWDGRGGAFIYTPDHGTTDPWNPEWTMDIGSPSGPKQQIGVGWRRDFSAGVALVNPDRSTPQQFRLGGTYYQADGAAVSSVTLGPGQGLILQR